MRHLPVDVARQFDKTRLDSGLLRLPRQIKGIDRNTMSAEPRPWIKRHEAEWLRRRRVDHFPHINTHAVAHQRDFVHQADVDHAECVLQELNHLGYLCRTHWYNGLEALRIEQPAHFGACRRDAADYLWDIRGLVLGISWIHAFRGEAKEKVAPHLQPALIPQHWKNELFSGTRIRCRFQNHEHARVKVASDFLGSRHDVTGVRILRLAQ